MFADDGQVLAWGDNGSGTRTYDVFRGATPVCSAVTQNGCEK